MWLTDVSIRRPVFITMVVLALIILGLTASKKMPAELRPKIDFPFISIVTTYPGAGPQEIETLLSQPIEDAVTSTGGLRNITSTSQDGVSVVGMEFELGTDLNAAAADVRDKVTAARASLPRDVDEPSIQKLDISAVPIMTMAVEGNMSGRDKRILADKTLKNVFGKVEGVAAVNVTGGDVREVSVAIDRDRLQAYGLTIDQVAQALKNENLNLPSGSIKEGPDGTETRSYAVRTVGEFRSAEEMQNVRIKVGGGSDSDSGTVRLGDIATVTDTTEEPTAITTLNGRPSVIMAIQKQSDANTVKVADGIKKELQTLNGYTDPKTKKVVKPTLPEGAKVLTITDESTFVKDSLDDVQRSLLEGILLVVIVVFLFLHSGRATIIVATAIPTSLIATYLPMSAFGFSMNMMTLLALALCVGILVDDSIVVLENIERHLRLGEAPREAAINGRSEIGLAAITITLVDVVVFVPIAFMGGIVGQFFRQFGITVATATLFSLFMSFTLTPMLASRLLKAHKNSDNEGNGFHGVTERSGVFSRINAFFGRIFARFEAFYRAVDTSYRGVLAWVVENRALTIVIGFVTLLTVFGMIGTAGEKASAGEMKLRLFVVALGIILPLLVSYRSKARKVALIYSVIVFFLVMFVHFPIGVDMFPSTDEGQFAVSIELPAGSGMGATERVVRDVEALLRKTPGMEYYYSTVGSSSAGAFAGGSQGPQYARISAKLVDRTERKQTVDDIVTELNSKTALIPGGTIRVSSAGGFGGDQPLQMEISGPNMQELVTVAGEVERRMKTIPGLVDVKNSWDVGKPELQVQVDRLRAADLGVSVGQIASALRTSIEGNTENKLRDGANQYDIRVHLAKVDRSQTSDVENIMVGQRDGAPVYLRDVADVKLAAAPNKIDRKNRQRLITVGANLAQGVPLGNVQSQVQNAIKSVPLGSARITAGGMGQIMIESFMYMLSALALAIALVYMLMGALFESFATPFVIMFSLPQAMIGALLALMLTGNTISIISMIGIIMLMGLVTKNAILLVDYTNTLRERGVSRDEALLQAGPTRLRPILMTTMAMIGGMLPTALAVSRGSEQRAPMAIAVIGGLIFSTMLTLLVIPAVYTLVDDFVAGFRNRLGLHRRQEPASYVEEEMPLPEPELPG